MPLKIDGVQYDTLTADPSTPIDGESWHNGTEGRQKYRRGGATKTVGDKEELDTHEGTANPHGTTLEDARTAGNTLSGNIDMGGNSITNMSAGSGDTDAATRGYVKDQVNSKLRGLDWQESVLDRYDPTGGTPSHGDGDRYLSTATANGWTANYIYESQSSSWIETIPTEGAATLVEDENIIYLFDGASWGTLGDAIDHGALLGLTDDDHTQYLLANGTRAMSGALDMGTNAITNVGNVDGVDVSGHASRHVSSGADEIDGDTLDIDWNPTNYTPTVAPAEVTSVDELTAHLAGIDTALGASVSALKQKSGRVLAASFSGNPKKATVTFSTAFSDTNYSVQLTPEGSPSSFAPTCESKAVGSFVINLHANVITGLILVGWLATKDGEN